MSKRTKAQWSKLIAQQVSSGLSASEFCRRNNLNAKYFSLRKRQLDDTGDRFVQLMSTDDAPVVNKSGFDKKSIKFRVIELELPLAAVNDTLSILLNHSAQ